MIYSNEDMIQAISEAFKRGAHIGKIAGADRSFAEKERIKYLNGFREKLKMPLEPIPEEDPH